MSKFFLDANFIISVFREIESNHELSVKTCAELLENHQCYISNSVLNEIINILMMRTKDINLTINAYHFMKDNLTIIDESEINNYNDNVFEIFKKYNSNSFKVSFIDCSIVLLSKYFNLDYIVTYDKNFKLFEDINLFELMD